jgi:hypothetical protein
MSSKLHCDVCDAVIKKTEASGVVAITGNLNKVSATMDLCSKHYLDYNELVDNWRKDG